jgi:hypothetical protein
MIINKRRAEKRSAFRRCRATSTDPRLFDTIGDLGRGT